MIEIIQKIWDSIKWGETVLLEYSTSNVPAYLGLYHQITWAKKKGYPVLIDDILDTFYVHTQHMRLAGLDINTLSDVKVIKIGGRLEFGNVLGHIPIKETSIFIREYTPIFNAYIKEVQVINPVLGYEKLFMLAESRKEILERVINQILFFVGNERRIAYYYVNTAIIEKGFPEALPLLEELATTVIKLKKSGKTFTFSVIKSINSELDEIEVKI